MTETIEIQEEVMIPPNLQVGIGAFSTFALSLDYLSVQPNFNPRDDASPSPSLIRCVKANGVVQPISVRPDPAHQGHYLVIDGERRYRAAIAAGIEVVPVSVVGELTKISALERAVVANAHRVDLTPQEKIKAYQAMLENGKEPQDIAELLGEDVKDVEKLLFIEEKAEPEVKEAMAYGRKDDSITVPNAARVAALPPKDQKKLAKTLKKVSHQEGLDKIREVEAKRKITKRGPKPRPKFDFVLAKDAPVRFQTLYMFILKRLSVDPKDKKALAHLDCMWILQGNAAVREAYLETGEKVSYDIIHEDEIQDLIVKYIENESRDLDSGDSDEEPKKGRKTKLVLGAAPAKRGRPKKVVDEAEVQAKKPRKPRATKAEMEARRAAEAANPKPKRNRATQAEMEARRAAESAAASIVIKNGSSEPKNGASEAVVVKRGRGRPRKNPLPV